MKKIWLLTQSILLAVFLLGGNLLFFAASGAPADAGEEGWIGSWGCAAVNAEFALGKTVVTVSGTKAGIRIRLVNTVQGNTLRLRFSNKYGKKPLTIDGCNLSRASKEYTHGIQRDSSRVVSFAGQDSVTIPAGETVDSDPLEMQVDNGEALAVDLYIKSFSGLRTVGISGADTFLQRGDPRGQARLDGALPMSFDKFQVVPVLTALEVKASQARTIVIIGDSTTIGGIPDKLAARIHLAAGENTGVVGLGISGNRLLTCYEKPLLRSVFGRPMLERMEEDALSVPGITHLVVKVGVNDILHPYLKSLQGIAKQANTDDIIAGLQQVVAKAEAQGVPVMLLPLTQWKGYDRDLFNTGNVDLVWNEEAQQKVDTVNAYIMQYAKEHNYTLDFSVLNDPADPLRLHPDYTDDGTHYTNAGEAALVNAIPLYFFDAKQSAVSSVQTMSASVSPKAAASVSVEQLLTPTLYPPENIGRSLLPVAATIGFVALVMLLLVIFSLFLLLRTAMRPLRKKRKRAA